MLKNLLAATIAGAMLLPVCGYAQTTAPAAETATPEQPQPDPGQKSEYVFVKAYRSNVDPEKYSDPAKAAELLKSREKQIKALHEAYRRAIKEDGRARKIQQQIRALLNELTIIIEDKESVKQINKKLKKIDDDLDAIPLKGAVKSPEPAKPSMKE